MFVIKKFFGASIPFLLFHILCCGGLLFLLVSSGYLLILRQEGTNKVFLIPLLILGGLSFWLYHHYGNCCKKKGHKTLSDYFITFLLYFTFSLIFGFILMIYVFIPWWIPNYKGGFLLPWESVVYIYWVLNYGRCIWKLAFGNGIKWIISLVCLQRL